MKDSKESPKWGSNSKRSLARGSIDIYAVQCDKCFKWRKIATPEEFEEIRCRFNEEPFCCEKKPGTCCEDPADIEYNSSRIWVIDKPNIPKTPEGFKRSLMLRKDFSKLDAYYITPAGKRASRRSEIESFLKENPEYAGVSISDFSFTAPKIMEDTLPGNVEKKVEKKGSASGTKGKKGKMKTESDDAE